MRPLTLTLTLLVLATAACETSGDSLLGLGGTGGSTITATDAAGSWSFTLRKTTTLACTGGSLADGTVLTARFDVLSDGTVSGSSIWRVPNSSTAFPLSGTVTLSNGATLLTLSAGAGTNFGMELRGTVSPSGTFAGTLTDPAPGLSPMFSAGGCEYSTAGSKA